MRYIDVISSCGFIVIGGLIFDRSILEQITDSYDPAYQALPNDIYLDLYDSLSGKISGSWKSVSIDDDFYSWWKSSGSAKWYKGEIYLAWFGVF